MPISPARAVCNIQYRDVLTALLALGVLPKTGRVQGWEQRLVQPSTVQATLAAVEDVISDRPAGNDARSCELAVICECRTRIQSERGACAVDCLDGP